MDVQTLTTSAFSQQRKKLKPDALKEVFWEFNSSVDSMYITSGYKFHAADGSIFTFFSKPSFAAPKYYVGEGLSTKRFYIMHLNSFYDLSRRTYTDALIQAVHEKDEYIQSFL